MLISTRCCLALTPKKISMQEPTDTEIGRRNEREPKDTADKKDR